jgi:hypothetical protein
MACRGDADVIPWSESKPVLDGVLNDACWASALTLTNLTQPKSLAPPKQAIAVRVCCNSRRVCRGRHQSHRRRVNS